MIRLCQPHLRRFVGDSEATPLFVVAVTSDYTGNPAKRANKRRLLVLRPVLDNCNASLWFMPDVKRFAVIQLPELKWPASVELPGSRFRLFVAADISDVSTDLVSQFATAALTAGMVYFCAWGHDYGRFHDIVDEVIVEDDVLGERRFVAPKEWAQQEQ